MEKFTDSYIKRMKPKDQRYLVREDAPRKEGGFCIRVMPTGNKSWQMVYTFEGTRKWLHLGDYPSLSLSKAREKFRSMKRLLAEGKDPGETTRRKNQERRDSWTVDHLCNEFLEKYSRIKKRPRSAKEDELNLKRDVRRVWAKQKARDISRGDVKTLVDEIVTRGSGIQANRTLATIRKMFAWGLELEVVEFNPASGVSKPSTETAKDRCLSNAEIVILWRELSLQEATPSAVRVALKLILLTGLRPGEVLGAKWDQVDNNWLELPGASTKNKTPHRAYLSALTLDLLGKERNGYLVKRDGIKRLEVYTLSAWVRSSNHFGLTPWTPHDLRRTCATKLAEMGTAPHIISKILNHKPVGITAQVYDMHLYSDDIRKALSKWGRNLEKLINTSEETGKLIRI